MSSIKKIIKRTSLASAVGAVMFANADLQAKDYKGAEISSTSSVQYGRFVIRMQAARASGMLSTFFTYKQGSEQSGTFWEEIDIEVLGRDNAERWQSNIIIGDPRETTEGNHNPGVSLADDYHTYTLEWTDSYVAWYLDGNLVRQINGGTFVNALENPQDMRFNIWAANIPEWVGPFNGNDLPVYQFVNWFEYHSYDESTGEFELEFRDDFDTFDSSRWAAASHTFDENLVDFTPENAIVQDGTLILALTREGQTGFNGNVPSDNGEGPVDPGCEVFSITDRIQAEDYCNMNGIRLQDTQDTGGGENVGWIDPGDWMSFVVDIPSSGSYDIDYRVASTNGNGELQTESDQGQVFSALSIPNSGGWQSWTTISQRVELQAGEQIITIAANAGGWNINWLEVSTSTTTPTPTPTFTPTPTPTPTVTPTPTPTTGEMDCNGITEYPNWLRRDWSGGSFTHNLGGDEMQYGGSLYVANWYTRTLPGSDGSWTYLGECE